jgi:hypothetical protein
MRESDDAMAYLNLRFHERADLECDNPPAREDDLKTADQWVDQDAGRKEGKGREGQAFGRS